MKDTNDATQSTVQLFYDESDLPSISRSGITGYTSSYGDTTKRGDATRTRRYTTASAFIDTRQQFDIAGNVDNALDGNLYATTMTYACNFSYIQGVTKGGLTHSTFWDCPSGKPTSIQDPNLVSTTLDYTGDPLDRLSKVVRASGTSVAATTNFVYDSSFRWIRTLSDLKLANDQKLVSAVYNDGLGRKIESRAFENSDPLGSLYITTTQTYDAMGRPSCTSNPMRPGDSVDLTCNGYDGLSRVTTVTAPGIAVTTTTYTGNQTTVADPMQAKRVMTNDGLGRLGSVVENPDGAGGLSPYTTSYTYDALDDLLTVNQSGQASCQVGSVWYSRCFSYDQLKRLLSATNPEHASTASSTVGGTTSYQYDNNGNLINKIDPRQVTTRYGQWVSGGYVNKYDALDRLGYKDYPSGASSPVTFCYDGKVVSAPQGCTSPTSIAPFSAGHMTDEGNGISKTTFTAYDPQGRVTGSAQTVPGFTLPFNFTYGYNLAGGLTSLTYPSQRIVTYDYDPAGRVTHVWNGTGTADPYASVSLYAPHGAIKNMTLGPATNMANVSIQTVFNNRLQPTQIQANGGALLGLVYDYCAGDCTHNNGNVRTQTISFTGFSEQQTYGYDPLNRLTAAQTPLWSQSNGFDAWGNRWVSGTQPGLSPLTTQTPQSGSWFNTSNNQVSSWSYDHGNLLAAGVNTLAYDEENRMVSRQNSALGQKTQYGYDAEGRRVTKTELLNNQVQSTTTFVYDAQGQLAAEYGPASDAGRSYLVADSLGSTRLVLDGQTAAVKSRYDYLPFGEEIFDTYGGRTTAQKYRDPSTLGQTDIVAEKFTGKERDAETGLDYFGARYFSGAQGRFTSTDRVIVTPARMDDPQRFNLYSYARNNPFRFIDPNGEDIDFANDTEEGRKKALALVTKNLTSQEAANIGIQQNKSGAYEAYVIDKNAIGKDASGAYTQLTGLINDHSIVADVGLVGGGLTATFTQGALAGRGSISSFSIMGAEGGTTFEPVNRHVDILVNQGDLPGGVQVWCCNGKAVYQGVEPDFVTMWHELLGEALKYRAGHQNLLHNPGLDSQTVIKIENEIRAVHGMNPRTGADHGQTVITVEGKVH